MGDHVFVAGNDGFQSQMRTFLELRGAKSPTAMFITNIQHYVKYLNENAGVTRPVGHIYIGTHAGPDGWMDIDLDDEQPMEVPEAHTDIPDLERAKASGSVKLNPATIDTTNADLAKRTEIRVRGCEIGQVPAFVKLLKEALGDQAPVIAPKFFNAVAVLTDSAGLTMGALEFFSYTFLIRRTERYADRRAALADFKAKTAQFKLINGAAPPDTAWGDWLPVARDSIWDYDGDDLVFATRSKTEKLGTQLIAGNRTFDVGSRLFFYRRDAGIRPPNVLPGDPPAADNPALDTDASRKAYAKKALAKVDAYKASAIYPRYKEFGFDNLNDMVDGITWRVVTLDAAAGKRRLVGSQYQYTVAPPIINETSKVLRFNYEHSTSYPDEPTVVDIPETDSFFFERV